MFPAIPCQPSRKRVVSPEMCLFTRRPGRGDEDSSRAQRRRQKLKSLLRREISIREVWAARVLCIYLLCFFLTKYFPGEVIMDYR